MNSWSLDSFEDDELSWVGASWKRSQQLVEQDLEAYRPSSRDFSGDEPEKPTYDPWAGGWY
jgi:hypothetical protein